MDPFFGPQREEALALLESDDVSLPIVLGDGIPSFRIERRDGLWMLCPLVVDYDAAVGLQQSVVDDSGLYTWDFVTSAEPIFATGTRDEFLRWLRNWPWLGTGLRRAAPKHPRPDSVEVVLEHLERRERTVLRWSADLDRPAVETIEVVMVRGDATARESIEAPADLWDELVDVLVTIFEPTTPIDDATMPQIRVPDAVMRQTPGREAIPTKPMNLSADEFLNARVQIVCAGEDRHAELKGEEARQILDTLFFFAAELGLPLPR
jgi:hypothetical protein